MSEERFTRIDERLDGMAAHIDELRADVTELKTDVSALKVDVRELKVDVSQLKVDVTDLKTGKIDLVLHMRVLYEDTKQTLKTLQEGQDDMPRRIQLAVETAMANVNQRVMPIELAEQFHTRVLDDHERRITDLESRSPR
jgi:chromosome segregation ATPase